MYYAEMKLSRISRVLPKVLDDVKYHLAT